MNKQQTNTEVLEKITSVMPDIYMESDMFEEDIEDTETVENNKYEVQKAENLPTGAAMTEYMKNISQFTVLSAEEEISLFKRIEAGDREAYEKIYSHNLRLVVNIAKHYFKVATSMEPLDVIMEGNIGLSKAIRHFDYKMGNKFSTYAIWWIRQSITRSISNSNRMIRLPVHVSEMIRKYKKYENEIKAARKTMPSDDEIAKSLQITREQLKTCQDILINQETYVSLNKPLEDDETNDIMFFIPASINIEADCINKDLNKTIHEILEQWTAKLPKDKQERNRNIVIRRFGLNTDYPESLEDIGKDYGISRERVRQIEASFIKYARRPNIKRQLSAYIE